MTLTQLYWKCQRILVISHGAGQKFVAIHQEEGKRAKKKMIQLLLLSEISNPETSEKCLYLQ